MVCFIEVEGHACRLKRSPTKIELALLMLSTSDTEMDPADVVLAAGSSSNVLLWTLRTFRTMPCLSTLVVNPVELWDDALVQRLLVPDMTDWALGDDCCAASKLDGDGRRTEER
jgi:hypothetical protein